VIRPPLIAQLPSMVRETALVGQIGLIEFTLAASMLSQRGFSALITCGTALAL